MLCVFWSFPINRHPYWLQIRPSYPSQRINFQRKSSSLRYGGQQPNDPKWLCGIRRIAPRQATCNGSNLTMVSHRPCRPRPCHVIRVAVHVVVYVIHALIHAVVRAVPFRAVHTHTHTCMHTHMHTHTRTHARKHMCAQTLTCACTHACTT